MTDAQKFELLLDVVGAELKPVIAEIESTVPANLIEDYWAVLIALSQRDKSKAKLYAQALLKAGANEDAVMYAMQRILY